MKVEKEWIRVIALTVSLPSMILATAWLAKVLVDERILTKTWAWILFLCIIGNSLFLIVWYAYKNRSK